MTNDRLADWCLLAIENLPELGEGDKATLRLISERLRSARPEELPRMPTMEMREAGRAVHQAQEREHLGTGKVRMRFDLVTEIWRAMYDAAKPLPQKEKS